MKDKQRKKQLLENGDLKNYLSYRQDLIKMGGYENLDFNLDLKNNYDFTLCEQMRRARYEQSKKVQNHIQFLFNLEGYLYFATFTFKDESLLLSAYTRKQKIRRLLSSNFDDYILNIDFGSKNEREHFHAIIYEKIDNSYIKDNHLKHKKLDSYNLGIYDLQKIQSTDISKVKLGKYISKLTLHSIKVKQSYVSVKKGSLYQRLKKNNKEIRRLSNEGMLCSSAIRKKLKTVQNENKIIRTFGDMFEFID